MAYRYELDGKGYPSVTEIIHEVIGSGYGMQVGEYYLKRGQAVHACAAMLAQGKEFDYDPRIHGQVEAIKSFLNIYDGKISAIEESKISKLYGFAGTADLVKIIKGKKVICDYKGSIPKTINIQLAGYGILHDINWGMGVHIRADRTFAVTEIIDLRKFKKDFFACLTVYNLRRQMQ